MGTKFESSNFKIICVRDNLFLSLSRNLKAVLNSKPIPQIFKYDIFQDMNEPTNFYPTDCPHNKYEFPDVRTGDSKHL
jgi:hypothetical protein